MIVVLSALQGSTPIATRRLHVALRPHIQPLAARARQKSTPPDFAIAGVEKGGTTGLAWHLRFFSVCMYGETEYHKVDSIRFLRRPTWPRPRTGCNVTGFDDPNLFYIAPTHAAQLRMAAPAIRLVVLLREPVQRAHSRWQMEVERNFAVTRFSVAASRRAYSKRVPVYTRLRGAVSWTLSVAVCIRSRSRRSPELDLCGTHLPIPQVRTPV